MIPHPIPTMINLLSVSCHIPLDIEILEYQYQYSPLTGPLDVTVSPLVRPLIFLISFDPPPFLVLLTDLPLIHDL